MTEAHWDCLHGEHGTVADDVVVRLTRVAEGKFDSMSLDLLREAADEIERLREKRDRWQATAAGLSQDISNADDEIERLRDAGDALLEVARDIRDCRGRGAGTIQRAFEAWEDARRD